MRWQLTYTHAAHPPRNVTQQASKHRIETEFLGGGARQLPIIDGANRSRRRRRRCERPQTTELGWKIEYIRLHSLLWVGFTVCYSAPIQHLRTECCISNLVTNECPAFSVYFAFYNNNLYSSQRQKMNNTRQKNKETNMHSNLGLLFIDGKSLQSFK